MEHAVEAIKKYKRFLVTAHVNLEGDSLGSQLAMKELLEALGKKAVIVDSDPVPGHYKFLPRADEVSNNIDKKLIFDAVIVLDCPTLRRIGRVRELLKKNKPIINIDHHISNERFGGVNWVHPNASSAGEMVYRLFKNMNVPITKEVALYLYIAILTDTGSFNYDNTSSITHEIAGELLGYGLDPALVSERVYEQRSVADLKLLGLVLSTLKLSDDGGAAYLVITRKMLKDTGVDVSRSEGFINYARSIEGVKIAALFKEDPKDRKRISISFRSKGDVDVNSLASCFGGGGHIKASGCTMEGSLSGVKNKVLSKIKEVLHGRNISFK
ncbi:MAG: bifunctional oligoribonuclease/PAP phosphatase NrnA [Candidatus Omnitrophota bacterium]|nr:bifunctional oligoribonuclease/PAP phosphatase NrnA [Candidatus Omnitrophota bacterium]